MRRAPGAIVVALLALASPVRAQQRYLDPVFAEIRELRNLTYGSAPGANGRTVELRLDIYAPAADPLDARPAMVWVHGGGFVSGSKENAQFVDLSRRFARRGYVCASIDYRLATPESFARNPLLAMSNAMQDARAAVRYLRAQAERLGIDASRIAIGGGSAGAYTALLVAFEEDEGHSGNPGYSSEVSAVIDFWGGLPDVAAMEPGEAPVLIVHGTEDGVVPFSRATDLVARAEQVGVPYEFHPLEGAGHGPWASSESLDAWTAAFLYQHVILDAETSNR